MSNKAEQVELANTLLYFFRIFSNAYLCRCEQARIFSEKIFPAQFTTYSTFVDSFVSKFKRGQALQIAPPLMSLGKALHEHALLHLSSTFIVFFYELSSSSTSNSLPLSSSPESDWSQFFIFVPIIKLSSSQLLLFLVSVLLPS